MIRATTFLILLFGAVALFACDDNPAAPSRVPTPEGPACADYTSLHQGWNSLPLAATAVALEVTDTEILVATRDSMLHVLSLPGSGQPSFLDSESLDCWILDVTAGTGFVAVTCYLDDLALFELEADGNLVPRGSWTDGLPITEVEASDSTLVAIGGGLLRVLRVDATGHARLLGSEDISTAASKLRWSDPVASVRVGVDAGIQVFSLDDPSDPVSADTVVASTLQDYEIGAGFLVDSSCPNRGTNDVRLRDASNPFDVAYLGGTNLSDDCVRSVRFDAGRFYLEVDAQYPFRHDVYEFDPLDISSWRWSSVTPMEDYALLIEVRDGTIYTADETLRWAGLDRPSASTGLGVWPHNGGLDWMGFRDDVLFGVSVNWGLEAIDVSDPGDLRELGRIRANTSSRGLHVGARYVFFGNVNKLVTIDTQDPTAMIWGNELDLGLWITGVGGRGSVLYVDHEENGISIVDGTDPRNTVKAGFLTTGMANASMHVLDDVMVLLSNVDGDPAAAISDLSDPLHPTTFRTFGGSGRRWSDAAYDASRKLLYLIGADPGLVVYDLSDPLAPTYVAQSHVPAAPRRATLSGQQLYVLESEALVALDVTNPAAIVELGRYPIRDMTNIATDGSALFLAKWNDALRSFPMACQD